MFRSLLFALALFLWMPPFNVTVCGADTDVHPVSQWTALLDNDLRTH